MNFEDYLRDIHAEDYSGLNDDMAEDFDDWLSELDGEDYIEYGNEYGKYLTKEL